MDEPNSIVEDDDIELAHVVMAMRAMDRVRKIDIVAGVAREAGNMLHHGGGERRIRGVEYQYLQRQVFLRPRLELS